MTTIVALWLPILLSAVLVFVVSSILHMILPWHKNDYPPLPREAEFADAIRPLAIPPGDYMVPRPRSTAEMKSPEFQDKMRKGPVLMMTVMPNGMMSMGRNLGLWFVYILVMGVFAAYLTSRTLPIGADYLAVFRVAGATAFLGYAGALWPMSIWYQRSWSITIKSTIDGLIYALLTAGVFGWRWPH